MRGVTLALRLLEETALRQPAGVSELARALGLPKTTVHRSLFALRDAGWLEQEPGPRAAWRLSIQAIVVAGRAIDSLSGLRAIAVPVMDEMRNQTEENIHLFVRHADHAVLIERIDGIRPSRTFYPLGMRAPLHELSTGKAMLAILPLAEQEDYMRRILGPDTTESTSRVNDLRIELAEAGRRGFAVRTHSVGVAGDRAVAAPIQDRRGLPVAAVSVSAPAERLTLETCLAYGPRIADAARRISLGIALS